MRLSITVELTTSRSGAAEPERDVSIDGTLAEQAGPQRIGFTAEPGQVTPDPFPAKPRGRAL